MALNRKTFKKAAAGAAADTNLPSGYFNTVTYTGNGGTQKIGGYINRGATGFAYNKYITFPDMGGFTSNTSDADGALSIWINFDSIPASSSNYHTIIDRGNPNSYSSTYQALELLAFGTSNTNEVEFRFRRGFGGTNYDASSYTSARATVAVGTWYNLVVSYVASTKTATFYLNSSTAIGSYSLTSSSGGRTIDSGFNLGSYANTSSYSAYAWFGRFDQFRIFNKALSTSEVATLNGETHASTTISTTDIFSDNSGVALYQLDGNANDTGGVSGYIGEGAIFNGSSSYITINSTSTTPFDASAENFTVSAWINVSTFQNDATIISKWGANSSVQSYQLGFQGSGNNTKLVLYEKNGSSSVVHNSSTVLTAGQWYHIGLVRNSTQVIFYINGSAETISATNSINDGGSQSIIVGRQDGYSTTSFNGKLDQVRIYDKALSSSEVTTLYGETASSNITISDLVAYYPMEGTSLDQEGSYHGTDTNVEYNYNGTATNVTYQEATNFSPDLVWVKRRDASANSHILQDSIRGGGQSKTLIPDRTDAQGVNGQYGFISSFDSNGFTVAAGTTSAEHTNYLNASYVSWCFNAGTDAAASNTDGVTSGDYTAVTNCTVKANQDAGFSICKFTTPSSGRPSFGHGLSSAPEFIIIKSLATGNWDIHLPSTLGQALLRFTSAAANTYAYTMVQSDATKINIGNNPNYNITGNQDTIAYCFHSVDGIQKVGSYTGNGSASGPIVETGFEPAFVMIKNTDGGDSWDRWYMSDNKRLTDGYLYANESLAEQPYQAIKMLSNGFEVITNDTGVNQSSNTYIYLAIAADPDTTTPTVEDSFEVVTYTGNGGTQDIDVGFKPDLVWVKNRNNSSNSTHDHSLFDSIRGNFRVRSNSTGAENNYSSHFGGINLNGFTVTSGLALNDSNGTYAAWCFKAGDHDDNLPQINTEGTIDSTVSVNDAAGFSIVKWTGDGVSSATVGHGFSSAPEMIITKSISEINDWNVNHVGIPNKIAYLQSSNAAFSGGGTNGAFGYQSTNTATTFEFTAGSSSVNNVNKSGQQYIAYCFTSITGYQKVGSYTGTGSSGNAVTTGFSPRFVMIKDTTQGGNWIIHSKPPTTTNPSTTHLRANSTAAEDSGANEYINFDSNGFTVVGTGGNVNTNNDVYIYLAIA